MLLITTCSTKNILQRKEKKRILQKEYDDKDSFTSIPRPIPQNIENIPETVKKVRFTSVVGQDLA